MFWFVFWCIIATTIIAVAMKYSVGRLRPYYPWLLSWGAIGVALLVSTLFSALAVWPIGLSMARSSALQYEEWWNGYEVSADVAVTECEPGERGDDASDGHSNCKYEYRTGETYTYEEPVTRSDTRCDSDGNCETVTWIEYEDRTGWIYHPYAVREYVYTITDSLEVVYTFPDVYVKDREGYQGGAIPPEIPRGDPEEWVDAKRRLEQGNARSVTRLFKYDNYILASRDDMLLPYSEDVASYKEMGILPDHTENINGDPMLGFNRAFANKVSFVGVDVPDEHAWQQSMMDFNAALGSKYRGDMHLVLIDSSMVDSPVQYLNALKAYWLGEDFGRRAIAKNAIIVVAGVDNKQVSWAIASTGMPYGNEVMLQAVQNFLHGTELDPSKVIGSPRTLGVVSPDGKVETKVTLSETPGELERIVLQDFPFQRACMTCDDEEESSEIGFVDLKKEIAPNGWQLAWMGFFALLPGMLWLHFAGGHDILIRSNTKNDLF